MVPVKAPGGNTNLCGGRQSKCLVQRSLLGIASESRTTAVNELLAGLGQDFETQEPTIVDSQSVVDVAHDALSLRLAAWSVALRHT